MTTENGNGNANDFTLDATANETSIPIDVFTNGASGLESISHYLKEVIGLRYCQIAGMLNRDDRTIWGAARSGKQKTEAIAASSQIKIPLSIFKDRSLSVLEAVSEYLKESQNLRYCTIAALLNKDQRTIWTVYNRAKQKRKNAKAN